MKKFTILKVFLPILCTSINMSAQAISGDTLYFEERECPGLEINALRDSMNRSLEAKEFFIEDNSLISPENVVVFKDGTNQPVHMHIWNGDSLIEFNFYRTGELYSKGVSLNTGELLGEEFYCKSGFIFFQIDYSNWKTQPKSYNYYYCNGTLRMEYSLFRYSYFGSYREFFSSGKPKVLGQYDSAGRKIGEWHYYNEEGEAIESR